VKIIFASRRPVYPLFLGGAELSFFELARGLSERGHEVLMMGEWSPKAGSLKDFLAVRPARTFEWRVESQEIGGIATPTLLRLFIRARRRLQVAHTFLSDFTTFFQDGLAAFEPQVVCTHLDGSYEVVEFCKHYDIPVLHFVRDTFHSPNFHVLRENEAKKRPTACVANSGFLSQFLGKTFGVDAFVLHPIVDPPAPRRNRRPGQPGRRVMFSNPAKVKGGELMFEVAAQLPEIDFVLVPGWGARFGDSWRQLPNVEIHEWPVVDMRAIYETVDLVVVPTQENEAFGRVAIEAQHFGVPVAASRHSGFEEALGDSAALIEDFRNPQAWRETIRQLLDSGETLERLALLGKKNIRRFGRRSILDRFETILESVS
jgi:glycosyltransferase involved in cell wall biosynthesis